MCPVALWVGLSEIAAAWVKVPGVERSCEKYIVASGSFHAKSETFWSNISDFAET